jgi:hypothetical protein
MKRYLLLSLIVVLLMPFSARLADAAWVWQRLTDNSGISCYPDVAANGSNVHVVWKDTTYGSNEEIFSKHSTDSGASWAFQRLTNNSGISDLPAAAVSGSTIHVVWEDNTLTGGTRFDPREIFYKRSTNDGSSWTFERLSDNVGISGYAAVAVSGSNVHVVWSDNTYGNKEIFYKRSTDNGSTWTFKRLTDNAGSSASPAVAVEGNVVHVVWYDDTYTQYISDIFYKRSTDNGATWSFQRLTANAGNSLKPRVAVSGSFVHVVWQDSTFGVTPEIFSKRSTNNGASWTFKRISENAENSYNPDVSAAGGDVYIVWEDPSLSLHPEIFCKRSTDNGSSWIFERLCDNSGQSERPSVAASGTRAHVVWQDTNLGSSFEIFYKRGP